MTTKEKLIELLDQWAKEEIITTSYEDDFLESYTDYNVDNIPDFTPRQEKTIEEMYEKYIENEEGEE